MPCHFEVQRWGGKWLLPAALAGALMLTSTAAAQVIQQTNLAAVADTVLYEITPTNNLGTVTNLPVGVHNGTKRSRYLVRFAPEAALPPDAEIVSVEFKLQVTTANATPVDYAIHRMLAAWTEGDKTGNNGSGATSGETTWLARAHPDVLWNSPGGAPGLEYRDIPSAIQAFSGANTNVTISGPAAAADVQRWLAEPAANHGWMLRAVDETVSQTVRRINSREAAVNVPLLLIRYRVGPRLRIVPLNRGQVQLSFVAQPHQPYAIESTGSLTNGTWTERTNFLIQPVVATNHFVDDVSSPGQFYRTASPTP
jgi:hypothetical protein